VVQKIFELADTGMGQHSIAGWLNEHAGEPWGRGKRKGARWHRSYVRKVLTNPAVIGTFTPHARRIGIDGELDPVLVIRLGKEWVCVDGHHRIAAYPLRKHKKPIRCEWFTGTPTEAVDESMRRNKKDTLPVPPADRREEAWRRVGYLIRPSNLRSTAH
jgi:Recombinase